MLEPPVFPERIIVGSHLGVFDNRVRISIRFCDKPGSSADQVQAISRFDDLPDIQMYPVRVWTVRGARHADGGAGLAQVDPK
jgi:hypothetical protein